MKQLMPKKTSKWKGLLGLLTAVLTVLALGGCGGGEPEASAAEGLIIALEPDKDPDAMLADRSALAAYLGEATARPVEVIIPLSSVVIREGLRNGTIDAAYVSGTAAARLIEEGDVAMLLATAINGKPSYESYWVGLKEAPYTSVEELRGQPIAFASRTSTSGFLVPLWDLHKQGLIDAEGGPQAFFGEGNIHYGVGYVSAIERVLAGDVEAAAVSYYVLDKDKHLSPEQRARLRAIDRQGPVPTHVIVVRSGMDPDALASLRTAFMALNTGDTGLRDRLFGASLVEAEASEHLASIREALDFAEAVQQ